jgi:hypothetical protein
MVCTVVTPRDRGREGVKEGGREGGRKRQKLVAPNGVVRLIWFRHHGSGFRDHGSGFRDHGSGFIAYTLTPKP